MSVTDLAQLRHAANQQAQAERELRQALQNALRNPHRICRLNTVAAMVNGDGMQRVLMFGTPDGTRYEIPLGGPLGVALRKALMEDPEIAGRALRQVDVDEAAKQAALA